MVTEDNIQLGDLAISFGDNDNNITIETEREDSSEAQVDTDINEETSSENTASDSAANETDSIQENKGYFEFLKSNNLLLVDETFEYDGSEEQLAEAKNQTIHNYQKLALDAIMDNLPEDFKNILTYTLQGGTDYKKFLETPAFDDTTIEGQSEIIASYYKNEMQWSKDKIDKFISKMDEEEIAEEALELKEKIKEKQSILVQKAIEQQVEAQKQDEIERAKKVQEITASIETAGFVDVKRKSPLKNFIFNPVRKSDGMHSEFQRVLSSIQNNPSHLIQLADLLMDYDKAKGLAYERFEKKAETKLTQSLKENLNKTIKAKVGQIKGSDEPINWAKFMQ
jgi:hypothetical protein